MWYLDKENNKSEKYLSHTSINYDTIQTSLMEKLILANSSDEAYPTVMKKNGDKWL
jgi:hypothetical protein